VNPIKTLATTRRVFAQLRHDHRTLGIIFVVPCVLLAILKYVFDAQPAAFNQVAPMILGIFPMLMMFLVTSIVTLRERTTGTFERLMTEPISKLDIVFGYAIAFLVLGLIQASLATFVTLTWLDVTIAGSAWALLLTAAVAAFLGTSLGLFVSAFATSEFQAVELVMPIMFPQVLLCGLFVARDNMAGWLKTISDYLPLTYSVDAMKQGAAHSTWTTDLTKDLLIVVGFGLAALVLGSITIRRQD
jgi:ABC-2 type transport system permease protein